MAKHLVISLSGGFILAGIIIIMSFKNESSSAEPSLVASVEFGPKIMLFLKALIGCP
jgi:hypothetical protein